MLVSLLFISVLGSCTLTRNIEEGTQIRLLPGSRNSDCVSTLIADGSGQFNWDSSTNRTDIPYFVMSEISLGQTLLVKDQTGKITYAVPVFYNDIQRLYQSHYLYLNKGMNRLEYSDEPYSNFTISLDHSDANSGSNFPLEPGNPNFGMVLYYEAYILSLGGYQYLGWYQTQPNSVTMDKADIQYNFWMDLLCDRKVEGATGLKIFITEGPVWLRGQWFDATYEGMTEKYYRYGIDIRNGAGSESITYQNNQAVVTSSRPRIAFELWLGDSYYLTNVTYDIVADVKQNTTAHPINSKDSKYYGVGQGGLSWEYVGASGGNSIYYDKQNFVGGRYGAKTFLSYPARDIIHEFKDYYWKPRTGTPQKFMGPLRVVSHHTPILYSLSPASNTIYDQRNQAINFTIGYEVQGVTLGDHVSIESLDSNTFALFDGTNLIPGNYSVNGRTASFHPLSGQIQYGKKYKVVITTGVKDTEGLNLKQGTEYYVTAKDIWPTPKNLRLSSYDNLNAKAVINWDPVLGASQYQIYEDGSPLFTVTGTSFTRNFYLHYGQKPSYNYQVKAMGGNRYDSEKSDVLNVQGPKRQPVSARLKAENFGCYYQPYIDNTHFIISTLDGSTVFSGEVLNQFGGINEFDYPYGVDPEIQTSYTKYPMFTWTYDPNQEESVRVSFQAWQVYAGSRTGNLVVNKSATYTIEAQNPKLKKVELSASKSFIKADGIDSSLLQIYTRDQFGNLFDSTQDISIWIKKFMSTIPDFSQASSSSMLEYNFKSKLDGIYYITARCENLSNQITVYAETPPAPANFQVSYIIQSSSQAVVTFSWGAVTGCDYYSWFSDDNNKRWDTTTGTSYSYITTRPSGAESSTYTYSVHGNVGCNRGNIFGIGEEKDVTQTFTSEKTLTIIWPKN